MLLGRKAAAIRGRLKTITPMGKLVQIPTACAPASILIEDFYPIVHSFVPRAAFACINLAEALVSSAFPFESAPHDTKEHMPGHWKPTGMDPQQLAKLEQLVRNCGPDKLITLFQFTSELSKEDYHNLNSLCNSFHPRFLHGIVVQLVASQSFGGQQSDNTCWPNRARDSTHSLASIQTIQSQDSGYSSTAPSISTPESRSFSSHLTPDTQNISRGDTPRPGAWRLQPHNARQEATMPSPFDTASTGTYAPSPQDGGSPAISSVGKDKKFPCPLCRAQGIESGASRTEDLKIHVKKSHCTDFVWRCPTSGCGLMFEFKEAYKRHAIAERGKKTISKKDLEAAMVELVPQLVFVCGFRDCPLKAPIFEAKDEKTAALAANNFCGHVAEHAQRDKSFGRGEWDFCVEVSNLLRQDALRQMWAAKTVEFVRDDFEWQTETSLELKKVLERRYWEPSNLSRVLSMALQLGVGKLDPTSRRDGPLAQSLRLPEPTLLSRIGNQCHPLPSNATSPSNPDRSGNEHAGTIRSPRAPHPSRASSLARAPSNGVKQQLFLNQGRQNSTYSYNGDINRLAYTTVVGGGLGLSAPTYKPDATPWDDTGESSIQVAPANVQSLNINFGHLNASSFQPYNPRLLGQTYTQGTGPNTAPLLPEQILLSNSEPRLRARRSPGSLVEATRPPSVNMTDSDLSPVPAVASYTAKLEDAARRTPSNAASSHAQVRLNFSRPRKSLENLRGQSRTGSVEMTGCEVPPMPALRETHGTTTGAETATRNSYGIDMSGFPEYTGSN